MTFLLGTLLGLSTLLFIGPVFFYLLKSALEGGFKAGFAVAVGIILGDVICVFLALYGFNSFFENPENQKWIAGVGALILFVFGISYIVKPYITVNKQKLSAKNGFMYFLNGFLLNFVNPFVFAVWFGFYALNKAKLQNSAEVLLSLIITLVVIFATDLLKVFFAQKLTPFLNPKRIKVLFRIFGVFMLLFALRLLIAFIYI